MPSLPSRKFLRSMTKSSTVKGQAPRRIHCLRVIPVSEEGSHRASRRTDRRPPGQRHSNRAEVSRVLFFFLKHESTVASGKLLRLSQHLQWGCGGAVWSVAKTIGAQQLLFSIGVSVSESPIVLENGTTSAPGSLP